MKKRLICAIAAVLAAATVWAFNPAAAETTLKMVSFLPKTHPVAWGAREWTSEINQALKGEVKVDFVGGPEIVPRPDQHEAVKNGVVDAVVMAAFELKDRIPQVVAMVLSKNSPAQERASGFFDHMDKLFQAKMNMKLIGRVQMSPFYLWLKDDAKSLADLKGRKMRTGGLYDRLMRHYGMVPVQVDTPSVYTGLERGVVEGIGWPPSGLVALGWAKHIHHVIDLPFFEWSNVYIAINLDKWNGLPAAARDKIVATTAAFEPKMTAHFRADNAKEFAALEKMGLNRIKFSAAENKEYVDNAYGLEWKSIEGKIDAAEFAMLKRLTGN